MFDKNERQFQIIPVHNGLRKYVQYINICFPGKNTFSSAYTLLPNACGTISLAYNGNSLSAELWGVSLNPFRLGVEPNGYQILVLVKLTHVGLYQITKMNQKEFVNKRVRLEDVDTGLYRELAEAFLCAKTPDMLVEMCEKVMYSRIEKEIVSDELIYATKSISKSNGLLRVSEVAGETGYSERHLNRLFQSQIGMSIKQYLGLARFNYVMRNIQMSPTLFSSLSQKAGYFDQAHLDKDFKKISGISPLHFKNNMSDFYYDGSEKDYIILENAEGGK